MSKKKTILIVAPYFPPHTGGLERYASEVAFRLSQMGHWRVVVLTTNEGVHDSIEVIDEVKVYRLGYNIKISNTPFSFTWIRKVKKVLREVHPDIVNVHTPVPGIGDIVSWATPRNVPLVVTYHAGSMRKGEFLKDFIVWGYEKVILPIMLRKAKRIICSSDFVRNDFLRAYLHKSSTIVPATNTEEFTPVTLGASLVTNLLFIGGLNASEKHKGLDMLLTVVAELVNASYAIHLTVVGTGDMRRRYELQAKELGISKQVEFVGNLHGKDILKKFQSSHILVHPTSNDSSPTVIIEAMACGLPVLSTTVGGIPKLVENNKTGLLVEPNNITLFKEALVTLIENKELQKKFGENGRLRAEEKYSWKERIHIYNDELLRAYAETKTVTHVSGYYPPHIGGVEVVVEEVAREQAKQGYQVNVFTSNIGSEGAPDVLYEKGVTVRRIRSTEFAHTPIMWLLPYWLIRLPKKSVLHVHIAQCLFPEIALIASKIRKLKFILHFHLDVEQSGILGPLFLLYKKYILGFVLRRAEKIVVFSEIQKVFLIKTYSVKSKKICIIPNGVNEKYFISKNIKKTVTNPFRLLYVGRFSVQKRLDRIIDAVSLLSFPVELIFVGDGEDRSDLEEQVKKRSLMNVIFVGKKTPDEVREYLKMADAFVIPSEKEGMPIAVLEAMAAGLPVVASDVVGLHELVEGVGVLVQNPTPENFASKITKLYTDRDMYIRMSRNGVKKAKENNWPSVVTKLNTIYK